MKNISVFLSIVTRVQPKGYYLYVDSLPVTPGILQKTVFYKKKNDLLSFRQNKLNQNIYADYLITKCNQDINDAWYT